MNENCVVEACERAELFVADSAPRFGQGLSVFEGAVAGRDALETVALGVAEDAVQYFALGRVWERVVLF